MPFHNNYNPTSPNYFFHSNNNNLVVPSNTIHFTSDLYSPQKNEPGPNDTSYAKYATLQTPIRNNITASLSPTTVPGSISGNSYYSNSYIACTFPNSANQYSNDSTAPLTETIHHLPFNSLYNCL